MRHKQSADEAVLQSLIHLPKDPSMVVYLPRLLEALVAGAKKGTRALRLLLGISISMVIWAVQVKETKESRLEDADK